MYIMVLTWFTPEPGAWLQIEQPSIEAAVELAVGCLEGGAEKSAIVLKRGREERGGFNIANTLTCDLLFELKQGGNLEPYERWVESLKRSYQDLTFIHRHEVR